MHDLPELRPADCGHGMVPAGMEPNAMVHDGGPYGSRPARVCDACLAGARRQPRIETKDVRPASPSPGPAEDIDWRARGREAALAGALKALPEELAGKHPRSAEGRAWFAGYAEAKGET